MRTYLRLLRHRRFAALCFGQAISLLGDALFPIIVVVAAAQSGTPAETIGAVFAARFFALGAVVLFGGVLLDRRNPVIAAVLADSTRVMALLALAAFWGGNLDVLVLVIAVVVGACEAVSEPALLLIAPRTVGRRPMDATRRLPKTRRWRLTTRRCMGSLRVCGTPLASSGHRWQPGSSRCSVLRPER